MLDELGIAASLVGMSRRAAARSAVGRTSTYAGTAVSDSANGTVTVEVNGMVTGSATEVAEHADGATSPLTLPGEPVEGSVSVVLADGSQAAPKVAGSTVSWDGGKATVSWRREVLGSGAELPTSPSVRSGDQVRVQVVNGVPMVVSVAGSGDRAKTAIEQTAKDISAEVSARTEHGEKLDSRTSKLEKTADSFESRLSATESESGNTKAFVESWMRQSMDASGNPVLTLGTSANSFAAQMSNSELAFLVNGQRQVWLGVGSTHVRDLVTNKADIGDWRWSETDGHLTLGYIGA